MKKLIPLFINFLFFIFIFCSVHNSFSQDQIKIDSLISELEKINEDTSKIKLYLELGDQYKYTIPDTALFYYQKAFDISKSINTKNFIAQCSYKIGIVHRNIGSYDESIKHFLRALKIKVELEDKNGMSMCFIKIGSVHYYQGSYDKAIEYYLKALKLKE